MQKAIHTDRETARVKLTEKIEHERRAMADPRSFSTFPRSAIIEHAEWGLRWIDCAPEGANHFLAPLQDKTGTPMGGVYREMEHIPGQALRDARARRGRNPFSGLAA